MGAGHVDILDQSSIGIIFTEHRGDIASRKRLSIANRYLFTRLADRRSDATIFNDHIIRSRWNWQFTPELSVRVILQYESLFTNSDRTSLETRKNFNADFLFVYQVNAWTALYAGYNNGANIDLVPTLTGSRIIRSPNDFINDSHQYLRQVFIPVPVLAHTLFCRCVQRAHLQIYLGVGLVQSPL